MITRAWFAVSLIWFLLIVLLTHWDRAIETHCVPLVMGFALGPLVIGLLLKRVGRWIVYGD